MLYDQLWEIVSWTDWRLTAAEYAAVAICAVLVVTVLIRSRIRIRKRMETIETRLDKMQREIEAILQVQAALITRLNATSKVETDPRSTAVEASGDDIAGQSMLNPPHPRSLKA